MKPSSRTPEIVARVLQRTFGKIGELEPLKGGAWSTAYGFVRGSERLVVRVGEHVDDYERDRLAGTWAWDSSGRYWEFKRKYRLSLRPGHRTTHRAWCKTCLCR